MSPPLRLLAVHAGWVAVDKPAGLAVIPRREGAAEDCLIARLSAQLGERLYVVHRLDAETSGVLLVARNAAAHRDLNLAFEAQQISKTYIAWTLGAADPPAARISIPLHPARKGKMRPALPGEAGAKPAHTEYRTETVGAWHGQTTARLRLHPRTGRQHQLRVHLRAIGTPILRDPLYALTSFKPPWDDLPLKRLALHAAAIDVPALGDQPAQRVESPWPADLQALDAALTKRPAGGR